jgi:hypothetical protein
VSDEKVAVQPAAAEEPTPVFKNADEEIKYLELQYQRARFAALKAEQDENSAVNQERKLNLKDLKQRLADRENRLEQQEEEHKARGRTFAQSRAVDDARQSICTHKKGGMIDVNNYNVLALGGDSPSYAVIKHVMQDGNMFVRCLRCGRSWVPPRKDRFFFDPTGKIELPSKGSQAGVFNLEKFKAAQVEYVQACNFSTTNHTSKSIRVAFSEWDEKTQTWVPTEKPYDQAIANTNLR